MKVLFIQSNIILESFKDSKERYILVAKVGDDSFVSVVFTLRGEVFRIISARVAKKKEINFYKLLTK